MKSSGKRNKYWQEKIKAFDWVEFDSYLATLFIFSILQEFKIDQFLKATTLDNFEFLKYRKYK